MPSHIIVNGLGLTYKSTLGLSTATIPDVCKTPSPAGPVPIPYPNFASQATLKSGTTTVKAKGQMIAVKGSQYGSSNGDEAGTAGGVKSGVNMKATDWITYSFDVKFDGKNACRHTDKLFHNNQNAANLGGGIEPAAGGGKGHKCGDVGSYGALKSKKSAKVGGKVVFERDHVPAKAQLFARAKKNKKYGGLSKKAAACVDGTLEYRGLAIAIPINAHRGFSATCGRGNNTDTRIKTDSASSASMKKAINRDLRAVQKHLDDKAKNGSKKDKACAAAYRKAARKVRKQDPDKMIKKAIDDCAKKYPKKK